jgi:ABC-type sulfate transport system substrate-binding protein
LYAANTTVATMKLLKKPRGDVLLDHRDEARAVAFHVRSEEKQRVVGPNMAGCHIGTCSHMS